MTNVDMWFDPKCPWAWIASRWLLDLEQVRDVQVRFHVLSLAVLNEGREVEAWYREWLDSAWGPVRVAKAVEQKFGPAEVRAIYTALGNRIHLEKQPLGRDLYTAALAEAGLPPPTRPISTTRSSTATARVSGRSARTSAPPPST
jgi:protein-disulfide isomerase-like protein with CxxC motif